MARVHDLIRQWREGDAAQRKAVFGQSKGDDPIAPIAELIASEARLLCFDELQVTDIADAMILGRLFEALFEHRVVLAVTSNRAPDDLYLNGINRQLFEPFIDMHQGALRGGADGRRTRLAAGPHGRSRSGYSGLDDAAAPRPSRLCGTTSRATSRKSPPIWRSRAATW